MLNRAWDEREELLPHCPLPACRRSGTCQHPTEKDPCRRLHETRDAFYTALARKIDRIRAEIIASRPPGKVVKVAEPGTPLFERRHKALYDMFRAADQAHSAKDMAERAARGKQRQNQKPASAGSV
jgi:hypothetical protein